MSEIKIKIIEVKEVTARESGNKFLTYKTVDKKGKKLDVRFTAACSIKPKEACFVICDENDANVDTSRQYPCLWIKEVIRTEPIVKRSNVSDYIDVESDQEPEPAPFE